MATPLVEAAVRDAEVVINLVGILSEREEQRFDAVQGEGAKTVARAVPLALANRSVSCSQPPGGHPWPPSGAGLRLDGIAPVSEVMNGALEQLNDIRAEPWTQAATSRADRWAIPPIIENYRSLTAAVA
jgi:hypothetical protein